MTREQFIIGYATRSNIPAPMACVGVLEIAGTRHVALPCGCGDEGCDGWALLTADSVAHHLEFKTSDALKEAYRGAVVAAGGE